MDPAGPEDLPNELVCTICTYLPAVDVVRFLSTCKTLHAFMAEETIWRHFCATYDVHDPTELNGRTFFEVYSRLLHAYGPLIGLWASDTPYQGGILEFRFDAGLKAILGERWITVTRRRGTAPPAPPTYQALVSISLPSQDVFKAVSLRPGEVDILWACEELDPERGGMKIVLRRLTKSDGTPTKTLKRISPTNAGMYVLSGRSYFLLPDFPSDLSDGWYEPTRELPRLPLQPSPVAYSGPLDDAVAWFRKHDWEDPEEDNYDFARDSTVLAVAKSMKPAALYIHLHDAMADQRSPSRFPGPLRHNTHMFLVRHSGIRWDSIIVGARIYPLRSRYTTGQNPTDEHWNPASLEGLWLGNYGSHGSEFLWLSHDEEAQIVKALKVTGDYHVPRGAISWTIDVSEKIDMAQQAQSDGYIGVPLHRVYRSQGTRSAFGFMSVISHYTVLVLTYYMATQGRRPIYCPKYSGHH